MRELVKQIILNNLKVEVLLLETEDLLTEDILPYNILSKGQFERSYSKDILGLEQLFNERGEEYQGIGISREGIYDSLPVFALHSLIKKQKRGVDIKDDLTLSKEVRDQEKYIRQFFNPFEQELYRFRGATLKDEFKFKISLEVLSEHFKELIDDGDLGKLNILLSVLPTLHKMRGQIGEFEKIISKILKSNVLIQKIVSKNVVLSKAAQVELGEGILGQNVIIGTEANDFTTGYNIEIKKGSMTFKQAERVENLVTFFADILLPADLIYQVTVSTEQNHFTLSADPELSPIMGYNTVI